jgi:hypothetical protein
VPLAGAGTAHCRFAVTVNLNDGFDGGERHAGFRYTTLAYTFAGDPSATADAQVIMRAQLAPYSP